jgi:MFS family permease
VNARWALACFLALGVYAGAWGALIPDIKRQVGATDAELGLALLFAAAGTVPGTLLAGRLWRRFGWWLLPVAAIGSGVALVGPIVASTPLMLGVALLFTGATSGMLDVAMNAAVSDTEASRNARLMYGAHALFSLGGLASFPTGIARQVGAQPAQVLAVVALVYLLVGLGAIRAARQATRARVVDATSGTSGGKRGVLFKAIAALAVLCALSFLIEDAASNWSALHLEQTLLSGPALGGAAPGMFALAMFIGRSVGQRLGSRYSDGALLSAGAALAAIGLALVAAAPTPIIALAAIAVAGSGIALVAPALYARAGRMSGSRNRAAAIARLTAFGYTGFLLGPPLMGGLAQAVGLRGAFSVIAVLAALLTVGGLLALRLGSGRSGTFEEGEELLKTGRA